tara:strand:+ start:144 stop:953 length:810 start_codon:yes stop_codon:yes gene_type:complete
VVLAGLELALAVAAWVITLSKNEGLCPGGATFSCSGLFRERLGSLGPLHLSQLAPLGAVLTLIALVGLRLYPAQARGLRRAALCVPAWGAGIAIAAQVLALKVNGAPCLVCLGVAVAALGAALVTLPSLASLAERRWLLGAFLITLGLAGGAAFGRGHWLQQDDAQRRSRLEALSGQTGPELVLVTRPGCAFCTILELDRLGDPSLRDLLGGSRGFRRVPESDPLAQRHAGGPGTPVLLAIDEEGKLLGRLRGAKSLRDVRAFLAQVLK